MNADGNPATLRAAHPGNRNAMKTGVYSPRARAERVAEIRGAAEGRSTFALAVAAVREERRGLDDLRDALDAEIAEHGLSTRSGAAREQVTQRSSVIRQLERLDRNWTTSEPIDSAEIEHDVDVEVAIADALREQLLGLLSLRDLLDLDVQERGVSTGKAGSRRQVAQRVTVSRELVRLADRIRAEFRRAQSAVAPLRPWDVARDVAFDPSQRPGDAIMAIEHLLTHTAPPPRKSREELEFQAKVGAMSLEEIEAILEEHDASQLETERDLDPAACAPGNDEPSTDVEALRAGCLEILQRIGDGVDPRATPRDRMRAAELRERHLPLANVDPFSELMESWTDDELERELHDLLREPDDDEC
jgi:hypothetical protein